MSIKIAVFTNKKVDMLQQPLPLYKTADKTLQEFVSGDNAAVLRSLEAWVKGDGPWFILMWGEPGVGKSHLLQAGLREWSCRSQQAMYLPLSVLDSVGPEAINGLESINVVGIDDLDRVLGNEQWETALFSLFNILQDKGGRLLIAARQNPRFANFALADLQSRLCSGLIYQVVDLSDVEKKRYLRSRAEQRDLAMPAPVADYIVTHHARSLHDLSALFERLDKATLSAGRLLTVPFVKEVIAEMRREA